MVKSSQIKKCGVMIGATNERKVVRKMRNEKLMMLVIDEGKEKNRVEIIIGDSWSKVYEERKKYLERKDIKVVVSKVYELAEEKTKEELYTV